VRVQSCARGGGDSEGRVLNGVRRYFWTSLIFFLPTPNTTVNYTGRNFKWIMITGCFLVLPNRMAGTDRRQEADVKREHEHEGTEGRRRWAAKPSRRSTTPRSSPEMYSAQHMSPGHRASITAETQPTTTRSAVHKSGCTLAVIEYSADILVSTMILSSVLRRYP
jgi:hypothetical protein